MIPSAKEDCLEFDGAAFAQEAGRVAGGGYFLPNEVGYKLAMGCELVIKIASTN